MMFKNWRTSLAAVLLVAGIGLYWAKVIDEKQFITGLGAVTAAGFFASKDYENKTNS
jgi:hypothetical protein